MNKLNSLKRCVHILIYLILLLVVISNVLINVSRFNYSSLFVMPFFLLYNFSARDLEVGAEYQALSAKEESDLEALMVKYEFAISNAEAFTEQLNRELSSLDATNVHAIMESERKVQGLMDMFDVSRAATECGMPFFTLVDICSLQFFSVQNKI